MVSRIASCLRKSSQNKNQIRKLFKKIHINLRKFQLNHIKDRKLKEERNFLLQRELKRTRSRISNSKPSQLKTNKYSLKMTQLKIKRISAVRKNGVQDHQIMKIMRLTESLL